MPFSVEQYNGWSELPPDIQTVESRSYEDDYRGFIVIRWPEDSPEVRSDHGEPEDNYFCRDYSWIVRAIKRAYEAGRARGR